MYPRLGRARVDAVMLEANAASMMRRSVPFSPAAAIDLAIRCIDLTTLEGDDSPGRVRALCARAVVPAPGSPSVAAVCVYPAFIAAARQALEGSGVRVAAVTGAFPSGYAPRPIKLAEVEAALAAGADEIDFVADRSALIAGDDASFAAEIAAARAASSGTTLKVILETGELGTYANVRRAADLALEAGADFLKTSTGKTTLGATPATALLLAQAVRAYSARTGRPAGLKLAGGIRSAGVALGYLALVAEALGAAWLDPTRLRLGASALLDDLLLLRFEDRTGNYAGAAYATRG
jgi:deoxyribose-phosphate aldolase